MPPVRLLTFVYSTCHLHRRQRHVVRLISGVWYPYEVGPVVPPMYIVISTRQSPPEIPADETASSYNPILEPKPYIGKEMRRATWKAKKFAKRRSCLQFEDSLDSTARTSHCPSSLAENPVSTKAAIHHILQNQAILQNEGARLVMKLER